MYEKIFKIKWQGKESDIEAIIIKGALLDGCAYLKEDELKIIEVSQRTKVDWNKVFANCTLHPNYFFEY